MKPQASQALRRRGFLRGGRLAGVTFIVVAALLVAPAGASATSPVLEFVAPGYGLPVSFTTKSGAVKAEMAGFEALVECTASHGKGEITGPRSTVSEYVFTGCTAEKGSILVQCESTGAEEEKGVIRTEPIEADLVYTDQAEHQVGMLLNPEGGAYISFECGGETAEGKGPFLSPVTPINREAASFMATLSQFDGV